MSRSRGWKLISIAVLACGVTYTGWHFVVSGVRYPLSAPNLGQVEEEAAPLRRYHLEGQPVELTNKRQYGPTFFFVLDPLLRRCGQDQARLARGLYGLQLVAFSLAFVFTLLSMRRWVRAAFGYDSRARLPARQLAVLLGFLWLNFAPAYYIMAVKNVEMWELCLLAAGLYSFFRGWRLPAGACIAAAILTKMLPGLFLFYLLFRDRRTFLYCCLSLGAMLALSHLLYGPQMGALYLPLMLKASIGSTHGLVYHENLSAKGMVIKLFSHWKLAPNYFTELTPQGLMLANVVGHLVQFGGLLWMAWVFASRPPSPNTRWASSRVAWEWCLTSVMMLILSPVTAFEYTVLALMAFSLPLAALAADRALRGDRTLVVCFSLAVVLVANIVPREAINRLFFMIEWLNRATGNPQLTLSEGYQYYGFPFIGLVLLIVALWRVRRRVERQEEIQAAVTFTPRSVPVAAGMVLE